MPRARLVPPSYERVFELWREWPGSAWDPPQFGRATSGLMNTRQVQRFLRDEEEMIRRGLVEPSVYVVRLGVKP